MRIDDRYEVQKKLGAGSMGVVYLARDVFLERSVAIKLIDPVHASDPVTTERFKKEAQALAKIRHANVVQIYAFGPHERSFFFAMEYVAGRSLEEAIDAGNAGTVGRGIEILQAIAEGLDAVHALKLVHRDVKPSNIVIEHDTGRPVLIDFGLARKRTASNPRLSISGGTPMYMAPEQAADPNGTNVTFKADIYALACSAWELFTGGAVFDGKDIFEILLGHMKRPPPLLSARRPDLAAMDGAFVRALSKDPLLRHDSASAFVRELAIALELPPDTIRMPEKQTSPAMRRPPAPPIPRGDKPEDRVLLLGRDDGLVRQMSRATRRAITDSGRDAAIESFAAAGELVQAFMRSSASLVLIDEEGTHIEIHDLVRQLRGASGGRSASILVVSRDWQALRPTLGALGVVDVLPKPLVVQMLAAAVTRIVARRSHPGLEMG